MKKETLANLINVGNRTMFINDNLDVLSGINDSCVDLIYLDPPFNSNRVYKAPIGSKAEGASFDDVWTLDKIDSAWIDVIGAENPKLASLVEGIGDVNGNGDKSYLVFMARRLIELHRVLNDTGSLYLHCDPTMSHSLKLLMDCIFGKGNFRNEIIWHYGKWSNAARYFQRNHDVILFYTKSDTYTFNPLYIPRAKEKAYGTNRTDSGWQLLVYDRENTPADVIERYKSKGYKIVPIAKKGVMEHDTWTYVRDKTLNFLNSQSNERTGYRTQKPLTLLERIIAASSNAEDIVLDPFCGCATACVAAERLGRQWVGIDIIDKAVDLIRERLEAEENLWRQVGKGKHINRRVDLPERTDTDIITNMQEHKDTLYGKCGGECQGCRRHFEKHHLEIDHKTPRNKGGTDTKGNLQLLCGNCNRIKGNRTHEYLHARLKELKRI